MTLSHQLNYFLFARTREVRYYINDNSKPGGIRRRKAIGSNIRGQPVANLKRKGSDMADFHSKRLKRIKFQAVLASVFSIAILATAGTATFAWFTVNRKVSSSYDGIVSMANSNIKGVEYFNILKVDTAQDGTKQYHFNATPTTTNYAIGEYSRAWGKEEHQILIKVTLNADSDAMKCLAAAKENILHDKNSWTDVDWNNPGDGFPLSSIVSMNYYTEASEGSITVDVTNDNGEVTGTKNYDVITINKPSTTTDYSFVSIDDHTDAPTFTQELSLADSIASSGGETCFYIVMDYNLRAIDSIYSYNIGNPIFESEEGVKFACDFSVVVVE